MRLRWRISWGCSHVKACLGLEEKKHQEHLLIGCWPDASVPHHTGFSDRASGVSSKHGSLLSPRASDPRKNPCGQSGSCSIFYNQISKVTYHHLWYILLATQLRHSTLWKRIHKGVPIRGLGSLGHSWRLSSTSMLSGEHLTHTQGSSLTLPGAFKPGKVELMKEWLGEKKTEEALNFRAGSRRDFFSKEISI